VSDWQQHLSNGWLRRGLLAWLLWPLSLVFGLAVALRRRLYQRGWLRSGQLPVPVLVIGNVVAGGAGKTPLVLALLQHLQQRGIVTGVVSRGHGRRTKGCLEVTLSRTASDTGDEPCLIHRRSAAPVWVGEDRLQAAQALLRQYPDTQLILSDDGLQHLRLPRSLEIGVFDDRGVGNGLLLPAGPLREPWPRPLDLVVHTGLRPAFAGWAGQRRLAAHVLRADGSQFALAELARCAPLLALAGIAQPEAFFAMLRACNVPLARTLALPDHYNFDSFSRNEYKGYTLVCTEKDAVKLWPIEPLALAVALEFELPGAFWNALDALLQPLLAAPMPLSSAHGHTTA